VRLTPAKLWLSRHKQWRSKRTAGAGVTTVADLNRLDEEYLQLVQANALSWCVGKTEERIKQEAMKLYANGSL